MISCHNGSDDEVHTQRGPESVGGSVTQTQADQGWSKACSEEFNTDRLTTGVYHIQSLKKVVNLIRKVM